MAPKSNKGSMLQKKNSRSTSKPLEPDKDREDLYGDDPPPLERTDGNQQAQSSETIARETPDEADIAIILDDGPSALTKLTTETALIENTRAEGSGKGKEKEGPDTRKKPPTFPKFIQELKDILAECTSQWENFGDHAKWGHQVCTFRKLYDLMDMPDIEIHYEDEPVRYNHRHEDTPRGENPRGVEIARYQPANDWPDRDIPPHMGRGLKREETYVWGTGTGHPGNDPGDDPDDNPNDNPDEDHHQRNNHDNRDNDRGRRGPPAPPHRNQRDDEEEEHDCRYRGQSQGIHSHQGLTPGMSGYTELLLEKYRQRIYEAIAQPKYYKGQDNIDAFNEWAMMQTASRMLGPVWKEWFDQEVDSPDRTIRDWTFEDFYSPAKGVLAFYNDLKHRASRMVQLPDEYSMKRKFVNGLPLPIAEGVLKSRGVSAEHTPMDQILIEVQRMETSHERRSTPVGQSPRKDSGPPHQNIKCYCCGKEGHYANECNQKDTTSKDSKTGKARLFATKVIEDDNADTTPKTQEAEAPSHSEEDWELHSGEEADANDEVIDIYGEYYDSDDDGEPIMYLGSMDMHDFDDDDEQICYA
ncbi:hypothetical protein PISMIDRAFT_16895 [Pisolithus microcarpus 441]|uniref:CCHC-type domain-containing protein n=1 Tax=Pisolithus microcarpus 441 TaxID=765257 RepID=A0A0C9YM29_9AGAM|nr:hypothetical protein PISMIDRAFT_16895 [Pisolithus microcarpus 441]